MINFQIKILLNFEVSITRLAGPFKPDTLWAQGGDILDEDVIHYDTWLRKDSQYAFTRLSAKGFFLGGGIS